MKRKNMRRVQLSDGSYVYASATDANMFIISIDERRALFAVADALTALESIAQHVMAQQQDTGIEDMDTALVMAGE